MPMHVVTACINQVQVKVDEDGDVKLSRLAMAPVRVKTEPDPGRDINPPPS